MKPIGRFGGSGGVISARRASNTCLSLLMRGAAERVVPLCHGLGLGFEIRQAFGQIPA